MAQRVLSRGLWCYGFCFGTIQDSNGSCNLFESFRTQELPINSSTLCVAGHITLRYMEGVKEMKNITQIMLQLNIGAPPQKKSTTLKEPPAPSS